MLALAVTGGSTFERFCLRDAEVLVYWLCMGTCCCRCCGCGCVGPDVAVAPVVASLVRAAAGERHCSRAGQRAALVRAGGPARRKNKTPTAISVPQCGDRIYLMGAIATATGPVPRAPPVTPTSTTGQGSRAVACLSCVGVSQRTPMRVLLLLAVVVVVLSLSRTHMHGFFG